MLSGAEGGQAKGRVVKGQAAVRFSQDGLSVTKADLEQGNFLTINRNSRSPKPHPGMRQKAPGECV